MANSNQGGSILSFLVIGGVLTALLVGGTYLVQQRATRSSTAPAPVLVQSSDKAGTTTVPVADDKKVAVETKKEEPKKEAPKPAPVAAPAKEAPKPAAQQPAPAATKPAPATVELPKTGPADFLSSIIGAGLLSGMIVAYTRSRRSSVTL